MSEGMAKKYDPFIDLKKEYDKTEQAIAPTDFSYPSIYVSDIKLPITDEDLNAILTAQVKVKVKRIGKNVENGKITYSYDLEVRGIRFNF